MNSAISLSKYSIGVGDRFAHQAKAQLQACMQAVEHGVDVIPVWNKSNREHTIIGSDPIATRAAADEAVKRLGWNKPYHVDVEAKKGKGRFITEVSMDETDSPQTPAELLIILAAIADEQIPIQTIAPKFTGRFNKGVDYVGDLAKFSEEFSNDVAAIAFAVEKYGLPANLKLSVHSGSDKFSLYAPIHRTLQRFDAGVHLKTAGTNWLEELIGLAEAGGEGLDLAKEIYAEAYAHREELCAPYATVIDIDPAKLPTPDEVRGWSSEQFVSALRHDQKSGSYNSSLRQLLHVGFKVAAKMGKRYLDLLTRMESTISKNETQNLYERHNRPLFIGA